MVRVPPVRGDAAEDQRPAEAERDGRGHDRHDEAAPVLGPEVIDQRGAGRLRRRLADADAEARQGEHGEARGKTGKAGGGGPEQQADRQQARAHPAVGEAADRKREQRVEQREDGAVEQAHLGIADGEILLDGRREDREDLAVEQAHRVGQRDEDQRIPCAGGQGPYRFPHIVSHSACSPAQAGASVVLQ